MKARWNVYDRLVLPTEPPTVIAWLYRCTGETRWTVCVGDLGSGVIETDASGHIVGCRNKTEAKRAAEQLAKTEATR
jgi:hypothetical protein